MLIVIAQERRQRWDEEHERIDCVYLWCSTVSSFYIIWYGIKFCVHSG